MSRKDELYKEECEWGRSANVIFVATFLAMLSSALMAGEEIKNGDGLDVLEAGVLAAPVFAGLLAWLYCHTKWDSLNDDRTA